MNTKKSLLLACLMLVGTGCARMEAISFNPCAWIAYFFVEEQKIVTPEKPAPLDPLEQKRTNLKEELRKAKVMVGFLEGSIKSRTDSFKHASEYRKMWYSPRNPLYQIFNICSGGKLTYELTLRKNLQIL